MCVSVCVSFRSWGYAVVVNAEENRAVGQSEFLTQIKVYTFFISNSIFDPLSHRFSKIILLIPFTSHYVLLLYCTPNRKQSDCPVVLLVKGFVYLYI